ncbi:hypothetical protein [uncultured Faecalibaculum sp.]|uniref:hypothetical protein n=1 Tax=uncultured Faecalibaculum sp. TaxID=1729681 RepID=UPI002730C547|nr:hypothetical protein [uncultured Faecalibaculum sp.]
MPDDAESDNAGEEEGTEPVEQPAAKPEKPVLPDAEQPAPPLEKPEGSATGCIRLPDTLFPSGGPVNAGEQQPEITEPSVSEAVPVQTGTLLLAPEAGSWLVGLVKQPVVQAGPSVEAASILDKERQTEPASTLQTSRLTESPTMAETAGPAADLSGALAAAAGRTGSEPVQVRAGSRLFSWNPQEGLKVMQNQETAVPSRFKVVEDGQRVQLILPGPEPVLSAQVNGQTVPVQQRQEGSVIEVTRAYAGQQVRALTASGKVIEQQNCRPEHRRLAGAVAGVAGTGDLAETPAPWLNCSASHRIISAASGIRKRMAGFRPVCLRECRPCLWDRAAPGKTWCSAPGRNRMLHP